MIVECPTCHLRYNDENRWTICPHGPLWAAPDAYCRACDAVVGITFPGEKCPCGAVGGAPAVEVPDALEPVLDKERARRRFDKKRRDWIASFAFVVGDRVRGHVRDPRRALRDRARPRALPELDEMPLDERRAFVKAYHEWNGDPR